MCNQLARSHFLKQLAEWIILLALASCDTFQEDIIKDKNKVEFSETKYYTLPGSSVIIDLKSIVKQSFSNVSLKITHNPTRGELTILDTLLLKYKPHNEFLEGKDEFVFSVFATDELIGTETITIIVVEKTDDFPCAMYAVQDFGFSRPGLPASVKFLANDRLCEVVKSQIHAEIHSGPAHGQVMLVGDSIVTYTPEPDFIGEDEVIYKISATSRDGTPLKAYGLISLTVSDAPCNSITVADVVFIDLTDATSDQLASGECAGHGYEVRLFDNKTYCDSIKIGIKGWPGTNPEKVFCWSSDGREVAYLPDPEYPNRSQITLFEVCYKKNGKWFCQETEFYARICKWEGAQDIYLDLTDDIPDKPGSEGSDDCPGGGYDIPWIDSNCDASGWSSMNSLQPLHGSVCYATNGFMTYYPDPDDLQDDVFGYTIYSWDFITGESVPSSAKVYVKREVDNSAQIVADIDGNDYHTVEIGTQVWMLENLKATRYNDGTAIQLVVNNDDWEKGVAAYSWYNNDAPTYKNTYGALYNWYAVSTEKLCPTDWHVPSYEEWNTLVEFLGGENIAGGKLKETGISHWLSPNDATNVSGFTALPGGIRGNGGGGKFEQLGAYGGWWSSSKFIEAGSEPFSARLCWLTNERIRAHLMDMHFYYGGGVSVRCIKD